MVSLSQGRASPTMVLVIVSAGVVLANLDLFVVNVALPDIARDVGEQDLAGLSWVLNAYAITYAALLVLFGRLAERYDRSTAFLVGVAAFVIASALCAAATSTAMLVGFRILQAAGAALLTPTSLSLILATAPPERRASSVRTWAALGGLAAAVGPVVGGLLVAASWRWVFLINLPIGLVALVIGWRRLPPVPGRPAASRPDVLGALMVTGGVGLFAYGLIEAESWGWAAPTTLAAITTALASLTVFVYRCLRLDDPLIDPQLFRDRPFRGASVVAFTFTAAFGAMLLSIVLWAQDVWGWSAPQAGLAIGPGPLMVPVVSFLLAGRLIARWGPPVVIAAGAFVFSLGVAWWAVGIDLQPNYLGPMLGGLLLTGVGVGLTLPTLIATAASSLPSASFATGSGVVNMVRQVGLALGVAALVTILGTPATPDAQLDAFQRAWFTTAALALLTAPLALAVLGGRRSARPLAQGPGQAGPAPHTATSVGVSS